MKATEIKPQPNFHKTSTSILHLHCYIFSFANGALSNERFAFKAPITPNLMPRRLVSSSKGKAKCWVGVDVEKRSALLASSFGVLLGIVA